MASILSILSFPAIRLLLVTYVAVALFGFWGWSHFFRDPGSVFYDERFAYERDYSATRIAQATAFLKSGKAWTRAVAADHLPTNLSTPELCIAVPTVYREGLPEQYIPTTIASLVQGLTPQERVATHISLYFADSDHQRHPDWNTSWVSNLVDDAWAFGADRGIFRQTFRNATEQLFLSSPTGHTKGSVDYALAIQRCLDTTNAPFIAVFEGDTLLSEAWVAPTLAALRTATEVTRADEGDYADWINVRLFNQERSTGWDGRYVGANHEMLIVGTIDLCILLVFVFLRLAIPAVQPYLTNGVLAVLCFCTVPAAVILFFQAGKASLLPPQPGLRVEDFGCCSQGFIFNRHTVSGLVSVLRDIAAAEINGMEHVNYDIVTIEWSRQQNLAQLALYPMQIQHLGIKSSAGGIAGEARRVWSMAFEGLTSAMLEARRSAAMASLYGLSWREDANAAGWVE